MQQVLILRLTQNWHKIIQNQFLNQFNINQKMPIESGSTKMVNYGPIHTK